MPQNLFRKVYLSAAKTLYKGVSGAPITRKVYLSIQSRVIRCISSKAFRKVYRKPF